MSDFIFSFAPREQGTLADALRGIYQEYPPTVQEFHGSWGTLAVSRSLYRGLQPLVTERHIFCVIGGPVLTFTHNRFLAGEDETAGTWQLYRRWQSGAINWDEDLSGPFAVLILDKATGMLEVITDLMSFIPVFETEAEGRMVIGTHVDAVARAAGCVERVDPVSVADFILNGYVTYPHTFYQGVRQLAPASVHKRSSMFPAAGLSEHYWTPEEMTAFSSVEHAASELVVALRSYIQAVTEGMPRVGLFLSGGEDSRMILSLLPPHCDRDAFVFLDGMNREGKVAKKVAERLGARFRFHVRSPTRYLEMLPACADLVGSGAEFAHAHTYGYQVEAGLTQYDAVFGGFCSDALLKGARIRKLKVPHSLRFLPGVKDRSFSHTAACKANYVQPAIRNALEQRHWSHHEWISRFRPNSAEEWFELWPISMNFNSPNIHANRRLFRSFEPFMSNRVVKIAASVPQHWKLNRRLFQRAARAVLTRTRHMFHADGWVPTYPWYVNSFIQGGALASRLVRRKLGLIHGNQGPWHDLEALLQSDLWRELITRYGDDHGVVAMISDQSPQDLLQGSLLTLNQKLSLVQVLYGLERQAALMVESASGQLPARG